MKKIITMLAVFTAALTLLCGCASSGSESGGMSGTVATDGSTSMEKVIGALGEAFCNENSDVSFTYNPTGSGSGITAVSEGRCDIGLSSRALKDDEIAAGLSETVLAYDGIAVVVNSENPLSVLIGREAGSGTRDGFESITQTEDLCVYRQELTATGNVIAAVSQNPDAIGYASLAAVGDTVKTLDVDGVTPSEDTVRDGSYAIQRPFVLVTRTGEQLSAAAQAFFDYATSAQAADIIAQAGAVAAN